MSLAKQIYLNICI